MAKPEACGKCGAAPQERRRCPRCGSPEWILHHGVHYMHGAREVIDCPCPSFHSAHGRRQRAAGERQAARMKAGMRADWNRPVSTPQMARKAAEGVARGFGPSRALREAGYPKSTSRHGKLNRMIRAELEKLVAENVMLQAPAVSKIFEQPKR